ncbi:hypothetical protein ACHAXT_008403 [Thalassiosira profunda]
MAKRKAPAKKKGGKRGSGAAAAGEPKSKAARKSAADKGGGAGDADAAVRSLATEVAAAFRAKHGTNAKARQEGYRVMDKCDEGGGVERTVWPWFLQRASASPGEASGELGEEAAFALAVLSNRRGRASSSGDGGDGGVGFVADDYDYSSSAGGASEENEGAPAAISPPTDATPKQRTMAFATVLKSLFQYQEKHAGGDRSDVKDAALTIATKTEVTKFLISCYSSMELRCKHSPEPLLEGPLADLVGVRLWDAVPRRKRHLELKRDGLLRKRYGLFDSRRKGEKNAGFLPGLVDTLLDSVSVLVGSSDGDAMNVEDARNTTHTSHLKGCVSKSLELLLDLMSHPRTRTHVAPYLSSVHLAVQLALSKLYRQKNGEDFVLFKQQVDMLLDSERMETSASAEVGTAAEAASKVFHERAHTLQKLLHRHHAEECAEVVFAGAGRVTDGRWMRKQIGLWKEETLYDTCYRLRLVDDDDESCGSTEASAQRLGCSRREFLSSILLYHTTSRRSDAETLSSAPLYPTERLLWDAHSVPPGNIAGNVHNGVEASLSLPKLNARFLSAGDYLLRNFRLFRLESAYEIRGDIVDVVRRMRPSLKSDQYDGDAAMADYYGGGQYLDDDANATEFKGWARMGLELGSKKREKPGLRLIRVDPPRLGERVPSAVVAEIVLDLHHCATSLAKEWDEVGEFDNLFLVSVDATKASGEAAPLMAGYEDKERRVPDEEDPSFPSRYGIQAVRGCMVLEVRDEAGTILSDPALEYQEGGRPETKGKLRYLRVALDAAQYALDATGRGSPLGVGVYDTFNLVARRHGRENNFKSVLETVRGLMRGGADSVYRSVPGWLLPLLLGSGGSDLGSVSSKAAAKTLDYGDTFVDIKHLRDSFPGCELVVDGREVAGDEEASAERKQYRARIIEQGGKGAKVKVEATSYSFSPGHPGNPVRFTPVQVSAVKSGLTPGLTTIIGPPGTGKTDVAVQIISCLYASYPTQRTVVVTHSNAALNDIFDKVVARGDVDERHVLRLGSGEKYLTAGSSSDHDFTKSGRVSHILSRRGQLLEKVQQLSEALGISTRAERGENGSPSYTCETAGYFHERQVKRRIDSFEAGVEDGAANVIDSFPFTKYFSDLKAGEDGMEPSLTLDEAHAKISEIQAVFAELEEYRPMELLRSQRQRTDYLLTKQARVVAMTCTHAAIARSRLVELGFHYDNVVVEEAGQMLDVETFVPLLLQRGTADDGDGDSLTDSSRLKRVVLIGDHNQLPPVVKNRSFATFSRYDQSMFARLVRLGGVPPIELNKQGRARPDIARLYSWRYDDLGDLEHVSTLDTFQKANAGLAHTYQLINVDDFEGRGESTPTAYFYQNVGEAEYAVALFQYMVLIGYPPAKISILTTYNGQKDLITDILAQRCGEGTPLVGMAPGAVSTVDQYQGQQNDYIILSLVRTKAVGHLRDVRRLVVAVSRARLGLYVLGRSGLFCGCHELRRTMDQFASRPTKLQLVKGEHYPTDRMVAEDGGVYEVNDVAELGALVHSMQQEVANK